MKFSNQGKPCIWLSQMLAMASLEKYVLLFYSLSPQLINYDIYFELKSTDHQYLQINWASQNNACPHSNPTSNITTQHSCDTQTLKQNRAASEWGLRAGRARLAGGMEEALQRGHLRGAGEGPAGVVAVGRGGGGRGGLLGAAVEGGGNPHRGRLGNIGSRSVDIGRSMGWQAPMIQITIV